MNLSPAWVPLLRSAGFNAVRWHSLGLAYAPDAEIFEYAAKNDHVVLTADLDFASILALTKADKPSVVQLRAEVVSPVFIGETVIAVLNQFRDQLTSGALVTVSQQKNKIRLLPFH